MAKATLIILEAEGSDGTVSAAVEAFRVAVEQTGLGERDAMVDDGAGDPEDHRPAPFTPEVAQAVADVLRAEASRYAPAEEEPEAEDGVMTLEDNSASAKTPQSRDRYAAKIDGEIQAVRRTKAKAAPVGPVVQTKGPTLSKQQQILRLVAERPFTRFQLLDEILDREFSVSRGAAWKQLSELRKRGWLAEDEHDGQFVVLLTDTGKVEARQCPSSAE